MHESARSAHRFAWAALAAAVFIVYGSLYPFVFDAGTLGDALRVLILRDDMHEQPWSGLVANILLYMPLGCFLAASRRGLPSAARLALAGGLGLALSLAMELAQFFDAGRITTLTDVYPNVIGALAGAVAGPALARRTDHLTGTSRARAEPVALLLLALFLAYRLYPYVPSIDLRAWFHAARAAVNPQTLYWGQALRYLVLWWVVGTLIRPLGGRKASMRWLLALAAAVVIARTVIAQTPVVASESLGLCVALASWPLLSRLSSSTLAALMMGALVPVVVADRLSPFDWSATGKPYVWLAFSSMLNGAMGVNIASAAEKMFLYASLIWLTHRGVMPLWAAGLAVTGLLFATSLLATHMGNHSAETTDAVIALGMTGVIRLIRGERDRPLSQKTAPRQSADPTPRPAPPPQ